MNLLKRIKKGFAQLHRGEWAFTQRRIKGDTHHAIIILLGKIK